MKACALFTAYTYAHKHVHRAKVATELSIGYAHSHTHPPTPPHWQLTYAQEYTKGDGKLFKMQMEVWPMPPYTHTTHTCMHPLTTLIDSHTHSTLHEHTYTLMHS